MPSTKRFEIFTFLCIVEQHFYVFIVKKELRKIRLRKFLTIKRFDYAS